MFWYNLSARAGTGTTYAPCNVLWKHPLVNPSEPAKEHLPVSVGDQVAVKLMDGKCTSRSIMGRVTGVTSANNDVPRHILDIKNLYSDGKEEDSKIEKDTAKVVEFESDSSDDDDLEDEEYDVEAEPSPRKACHRQPLSWLLDYEWQISDL